MAMDPPQAVVVHNALDTLSRLGAIEPAATDAARQEGPSLPGATQSVAEQVCHWKWLRWSENASRQAMEQP